MIILGAVGIVGALIFGFTRGRLEDLPAHHVSLPPTSPFDKTLSGTGFVESSGRNINVGSYMSGIVEQIHVTEGDGIKTGDPLITLDHRTQDSQLAIDTQEIAALSFNQIACKAAYDLAKDQYQRDYKLKTGIKSDMDVKQSFYNYQKAEAILKEAEARLAQAREKIKATQTARDKCVMRSPIDGVVFKTFVRKGEYINEQSQKSLIVVGNITPLHVRIQVDEYEFWRYKPGSKAVGFLRSNSAFSIPLTFVRTEPFAASKKNLTGDSEEVVDTRVVELVYKIDENPLKNALVVGQMLDVFIDASQSA